MMPQKETVEFYVSLDLISTCIDFLKISFNLNSFRRPNKQRESETKIRMNQRTKEEKRNNRCEQNKTNEIKQSSPALMKAFQI